MTQQLLFLAIIYHMEKTKMKKEKKKSQTF